LQRTSSSSLHQSGIERSETPQSVGNRFSLLETSDSEGLAPVSLSGSSQKKRRRGKPKKALSPPATEPMPSNLRVLTSKAPPPSLTAQLLAYARSWINWLGGWGPR
jgi:hypothetical protein